MVIFLLISEAHVISNIILSLVFLISFIPSILVTDTANWRTGSAVAGIHEYFHYLFSFECVITVSLPVL